MVGPGAGLWSVERPPEEIISACRYANGTAHTRDDIKAALGRNFDDPLNRRALRLRTKQIAADIAKLRGQRSKPE